MTHRSTLKYVEECMDNEGLHSCFTNYSYFDEVKDKKFHSLRMKYLEYAQSLEEYIRENASNENKSNNKKKKKQDTDSDSYDSSSGEDVDSSEEEQDSSEDEQDSSDNSTISDNSDSGD